MTAILAQRCKNPRKPCSHIQDVLFEDFGEFCCNFYHVRQYFGNPWDRNLDERCLQVPMLCLDDTKCSLGEAAKATGQKTAGQKYAFAVVELRGRRKTGHGSQRSVNYTKKYSNCYLKAKTIHAEDFIVEDAYRGGLAAQIENCAIGEMDINITIQPCHKSQLSHGYAAKSCSEILAQLYVNLLRPQKIGLTIKVAFLHKAHWFEEVRGSQLETEIKNAREGIRHLMNAGIHVEEMNKRDWEELARKGGLEINWDQMRYEQSSRAKMDEFIGRFLENIRRG